MRRALSTALLIVAVVPLLAAIPSPPKIGRAVAESNEMSGRTGPLLIDVVLRIGGGPPSAEGVLATHPTGLARLELRSHLGFVERHLLQGDEYSASRDGERLADPHPFLPPVFLLQAASGATLEAALSSFGVLEREVVLGRLGEHDCYVIGGRRRSPGDERERLLPSLWIDMESYDPVRIVRGDGVEYRLGPVQVYEGIRMPSWIDIVAPGLAPARLEVKRAAPANAPAAAFGADWLDGVPADSAPGPGAATP